MISRKFVRWATIGLRKHQKIEDERFLYWCDVKGMLVWSEMAAAYQYSDEAVTEFTKEWMEIVPAELQSSVHHHVDTDE